MEHTRREAIKSAIAVGALAVIPAVAAAAPEKQKLIGVKIYVMHTGERRSQWLDISWERLRHGDIVRFEDMPGREFLIRSEMYHRESDGAPTVKMVGIASFFFTHRVTDELLRVWMREPNLTIEIPVLRDSKEEWEWVPHSMEKLSDGDPFRVMNSKPHPDLDSPGPEAMCYLPLNLFTCNSVAP